MYSAFGVGLPVLKDGPGIGLGWGENEVDAATVTVTTGAANGPPPDDCTLAPPKNAAMTAAKAVAIAVTICIVEITVPEMFRGCAWGGRGCGFAGVPKDPPGLLSGHHHCEKIAPTCDSYHAVALGGPPWLGVTSEGGARSPLRSNPWAKPPPKGRPWGPSATSSRESARRHRAGLPSWPGSPRPGFRRVGADTVIYEGPGAILALGGPGLTLSLEGQAYLDDAADPAPGS